MIIADRVQSTLAARAAEVPQDLPPPVAPGALLPTSLVRGEAGPELPAALSADAGPWGRQQLLAAYAQIRGKRYPAAQDTLRGISERMPGSATAREAVSTSASRALRPSSRV